MTTETDWTEYDDAALDDHYEFAGRLADNLDDPRDVGITAGRDRPGTRAPDQGRGHPQAARA